MNERVEIEYSSATVQRFSRRVAKDSEIGTLIQRTTQQIDSAIVGRSHHSIFALRLRMLASASLAASVPANLFMILSYVAMAAGTCPLNSNRLAADRSA